MSELIRWDIPLGETQTSAWYEPASEPGKNTVLVLAHGAGANMTPRRRRAMTCAYMPDGEIFNGQANVLPPDYVATLSEGDVLENDEQNPLLYHVSGSKPVSL